MSTSAPSSTGQKVGPPTTVPTSCSRNRNEVTTPKLPPPPRIAQNRSGFSSALARTRSPLGEHDVGLEQVVDRQAALAGQVAEAAAEREAADAGRRDDPARRRQPVLVGGARRPRPRCSRRRRGRCAPRGRPRPAFIGERSITTPSSHGAEPGAVVAAAADGEQQVAVAGEARRPSRRRRRRRSGRSAPGAGRSSRCRPRAPRRSRRPPGRSARR